MAWLPQRKDCDRLNALGYHPERLIKLKPREYFLMAQFYVGVYVVSYHINGILPWCETTK
jgi:hypothetical protein